MTLRININMRTLAAAVVIAGAGAASSAQTGSLVVGAGAGAGPHVNVFDSPSLDTASSFFAFDPSFPGGVRVAAGDVDGDGIPDLVTGAGPGGLPAVRIFSGATGAQLNTYSAFAAGFTGGVYVAAGDVTGDGFSDVVVGADAGGIPHVNVFTGGSAAQLLSFSPFTPAFTGGVRVAAGDVTGDGIDEIIVGAGPGSNMVEIYNGMTGGLMGGFGAFSSAYSGGIYVAAGDVYGIGSSSIIIGADAGAMPHVEVWDPAGTLIASFLAFDAAFTGGVRVASFDFTGDGIDEIIVGAGPGGAPHVKVFNGLGDELASFFAFDPLFDGGVYVGGDVIIPAPGGAALFLALALAGTRRRR